MITRRTLLYGNPIDCTTAEGLRATLSIPPYLYGGAVVPVDKALFNKLNKSSIH